MHPSMEAFLEKMKSEGRDENLRPYALALRQFSGWLQSNGIDPLKATTADLQAYQRWLANDYKTVEGKPLARGTQRTRMAEILGYYRFLAQRGLVLANPGIEVRLPRMAGRSTKKDYLDLQEATALVQTQARRVAAREKGSYLWAIEQRNLAMLCLALATGRRSKGLVNVKTRSLDLTRRELRVDHEKGKIGRVLPVAKWATDVCRAYVEEGLPRLLRGREDKGWLFPGNRNAHVAGCSFAQGLTRLHKQAIEENPDLEGLAKKYLSPHCLRVSFATLLFRGGCDIRSVNELMLHSKLSTTATYTPIPLEDLRRACRLAHPRA